MSKAMSWDEFRASGLLWYVNRILHTEGVSIIVNADDDGKIISVAPEETDWLGFSPEVDTARFEQLKAYRLKRRV